MATAKEVSLLVGTRKGAFILKSNSTRKKWTMSDPMYLGHIVYHVVSSGSGDGRLLMAAKAGHLGPTVYRSSNHGKKWTEATVPPAFPKVPEGEKGRVVDSVFWLTKAPGKGAWYAGTAPAGLFRSEDHGDTWQPISGFNDHPMYAAWTANGATPGGQFLHSIIVNPNNESEIFIGISVGGIFHSHDAGRTWAPMNKGVAMDFMPDQSVEYEYGHDPHCMVMHPVKTDRLYHQNHCGIYRLDRPSHEWVRIGKNMPKKIGDIGFPIVLHPTDPNKAWVFPMDGTSVWPRTSPGGMPAVYMTGNGGKTWKRQDDGLPEKNAWFTVKRQAMTADNMPKLGLYFGTSQGEIWGSTDEGESWSCLAKHLPEIFSLSAYAS